MSPFAMIVLNHVKLGREAEYLRMVGPVLDAMRHETTFINTVLHQSEEYPERFMLYETWADRDEFFQVQMKRPYRMAYEERLPDLLAKPREMTFWNPLRSDFAFFAAGRSVLPAAKPCP